jgi:excisionase family DNA binding protein
MTPSLQVIPEQRFFTVRAAAKYLGLHPSTLRKLSDLGELPARRVGTHRMFRLEDLANFVDKQPPW